MMRVSRYNEFFKVVRDDGDGDDGTDDETSTLQSAGAQCISELADLIVEAGDGTLKRPAVLYWLMNHKRGRSLALHFMKQQRDAGNASAAAVSELKELSTMATQTEKMTALAKSYGVTAVAKYVIEKGPNGLSEHALVDLITAQAKRDNPTLTKEAAFSKMFCEQSPDGEALRKAVAVAKAAQYPFADGNKPDVVGGRAAEQTTGDDSDALAELTRLALALRARRGPGASFAACFAEVYTDPANIGLAERERRENRPSMAQATG